MITQHDHGLLAFTDSELTSLRPDRRPWEIAVRLRRPGAAAEEPHWWFVDIADLDLGNADPFSLQVGGFWDRHPQASGKPVPPGAELLREKQVMWELARLTRGAHLVGCVVSCDAQAYENRMRAHGMLPGWHYHLVDLEPMMSGWLHRDAAALEAADPDAADPVAAMRQIAGPPWESAKLSHAMGVAPPGDGERHTAMGDCDWVVRLFDAVTRRARP